ncbi:MAG: response regulator, partial [Acidobacteria bacterium]|nr:response regulator [Acidobacteriota bacterium]
MPMSPTVLLADDSVATQRLVALTFADQSVRVIVARDGQDAINRMATDRPDLVLADTNMPCVDGYDLARWVRQQPHLREVPVLLLAGATDPVDEQRLHDSGANGVLEKPFEPSHVISRVKELLGMKGPTPAPSSRLVTASDSAFALATPKPGPGQVRPAEPVVALGAARPDTSAPRPAVDSEDFRDPEDFRSDAPIDELFEAFEARLGDPNRPSAGELLVRADRAALPDDDPAAEVAADLAAERDWFTAGRGGGASRADLSAGMGMEDLRSYGERSSAGASSAPPAAPTAVRVTLPRRAPADVFETLLAAEQGDASAMAAAIGSVIVQAPAPEITDEMLDVLSDRVSEKVQGPLSASLRESVVRTVQESMATEAHAAVAEAVQTAVDGSILGTLRGAVNEAVAAALPAALEQQLSGAARESTEGAVSSAVEQAMRDTVAAQVASLVRDTIEREMRDGVAPLVQQVVREVVGAALQQVVADAVFAAVPPAVIDAVRSEAAGQVRQTVQDTTERLVSEEIARIR